MISEIIHRVLTKQELENTGKSCSICGNQKASVPAKMSKVFTDYDIFKFGGRLMCAACAFCIQLDELRHFNYLLSNTGIHFFRKNGIEDILVKNPLPEQFALFITTSYKKHSFFRLRWNQSSQHFHVLYDTTNFMMTREYVDRMYKLIEELYLVGEFSKFEIQTGDYNIRKIQKYGMSKLRAYEDTIKSERPNPGFQLLLYTVNMPENRKWNIATEE